MRSVFRMYIKVTDVIEFVLDQHLTLLIPRIQLTKEQVGPIVSHRLESCCYDSCDQMETIIIPYSQCGEYKFLIQAPTLTNVLFVMFYL